MIGYPMAKNLREKTNSSDKLIVFDVNKDMSSKFTKETEGVEVAQNVREVAEKSVRYPVSSMTRLYLLLVCLPSSLRAPSTVACLTANY